MTENTSSSLHHVTWDEETIALHDIDRGTRMKIDEPDTPYHYYDEKQDENAMKFPTDLKDENNQNNLTLVSPARSRSGKEESEALEADELRKKLNKVQKKQDRNSTIEIQSPSKESNDGPSSLGARDEEGKLIHKDPQFDEKRKAHYNEFERVRAWKRAHDNDEDEDDGDVSLDEDFKRTDELSSSFLK